MLLCYVDHHDKAYDWAERRKLETHPKTGAAQLIEIRERVQEVVIPKYVEAPKVEAKQQRLFSQMSEAELLSFGVPAEWLEDVRQATEDTLLTLTDHLPGEAAEALLELATGGKPRLPQPITTATNPFDHPDAQRRFRVMGNVGELERAFNIPGTNGRSFSILNSASGLNETTQDPPVFLVRQARGKPLWLSIERRF